MNARQSFDRYAERAKTVRCPTCRTVSMLGMMTCAAAENGAILAFVGHGLGGDWPDPREPAGGAGAGALRDATRPGSR